MRTFSPRRRTLLEAILEALYYATGMLRALLAKRLIMASQRTRFRGVGGYSAEAFIAKGNAKRFPQANRESSLYPDFFAYFQEGQVQKVIASNAVLDFGCGYGGRTVDYARLGGASFVWGVEPVQTCIDLATKYAKSMNVGNVEFLTCGQTDIPLADQSVDVVVSYGRLGARVVAARIG